MNKERPQSSNATIVAEILASSKSTEPVRDMPAEHVEQASGPTAYKKRPIPVNVIADFQAMSISDGPLTHSPNISMTPPSTPRIIITLPDDEGNPCTVRRQSGVTIAPLERPRLPRKAATAPPGTFRTLPLTPHPPRRAISARMGRPGQRCASSVRGTKPVSAGYPRISQYGTSESRSIINRRKSTKKWTGGVGLKVKTNAWKMLPPPLLKKYELISNELRNNKRTSFSAKARVKETLKNKKLVRLNTNIVDFQARGLPDTPMLVVSTPQEMYGRPGSSDPRPSLLPYGSGLERRLALRPASGHGVKHFSLPLSPHIQRRDSVIRSNSLQNSKSLGVSRQNVYLPGPIHLAHGASAYSSRSLSFAITQSGSNFNHNDSLQHTDLAVLDEIAEYFEGFGLMQAATEDELDRFWEHEPDIIEADTEAVFETATKPSLSPQSPDWKARIRLGLDEAPPSPTKPIRLGFPRSLSSNVALSPSSGMTRQDEKDSKAAASPSPPSIRGGRQRLRHFLRSARSTR